MTDVAHADPVDRGRVRGRELWEFRALVAATYPLFLAATLAGRALGRRRKGVEGRSVFAEAHAAAAATLALAFTG